MTPFAGLDPSFGHDPLERIPLGIVSSRHRGSRGLGLGVVEAFVARAARVTVVARNPADLAKVKARLDVTTIAADVTDADAAHRIVREARPQMMVLNAGAVPPMGPIDTMGWANFSANWDTDVKGALFWVQAALRLPLAPGSRVLLVSSGGAQHGSPLSGGYAGAKRMLWFIAKYANVLAEQRQQAIRFQVVAPLQMFDDTGVGVAGADAYAKAQGITRAAFMEQRFGRPMSPREFGDSVVAMMTDAQHANTAVFGIKGDTGITVLEPGVTA